MVGMQLNCRPQGQGTGHVGTEAARRRCGPNTGRGEGAEGDTENKKRGLEAGRSNRATQEAVLVCSRHSSFYNELDND